MTNPETTYTDADYWSQRWEKNEISFHKSTIHPFLEKHLDKLTNNNESQKQIFFPFCGKELDMAWLASLGHEIVGVEFVEAACEQFFNENNIKYTVSILKNFKLFTSQNGKIRIYNGDFFNFNLEYEKAFECVWDRGALVALPADLRVKYAEHIQTLFSGQNLRYLLDTYDYDQELYPGPPHSVRMDEVKKLYGLKYKIEVIESQIHNRPFNERLKESNNLYEKLYLLSNI
ncbi:unnamed protein product [Brachionus calyciflorus]|uniref:thiopurine S-methyltransferase n=1 Tax=Brachionus calyciflorus TaxID=104777 RepID=A0A814ANJ4_9BILA|nr:unnamed protein product [Brachionus calyciflorus]